jgi:predicted ferric reductase
MFGVLMNESLSPQPVARRWRLFKSKWVPRHGALTLQLSSLLILPYLLLSILPMDGKGFFVGVLSFFNVVMMLAMLIQFPLAARLKNAKLFSRIDWNITQHKKIGQWIGLFFFLHPLLILLPKWQLSSIDFTSAVYSAVTSPRLLTGIIAWLAMIVWILASIFKHKLTMSYERWRLLHALGFIVILVLATAHVTEIGSHGQFQNKVNWGWWALCGASIMLTLYGYFIKPIFLNKKPFTLISREKVSRCDWLVTLQVPDHSSFHFRAGQFVWLGSKASAFDHDYHPFSIVSTPNSLPRLSLLIRELGDYTSSLSLLNKDQPIFIDGPYGDMALSAAESAPAIVLVASGVGFGPIMSLLRQIVEWNDPRPIRLVYGNQTFDQMVFLDEIRAIEQRLPNFKVQLVCYESTLQDNIYCGYIDQTCLEQSIKDLPLDEVSWYLCGSELMITGVKSVLNQLDVHPQHVHFEQLSF